MRLWIPALLLLGCFAAATLWQSLWTRDLRHRRDRVWESAKHGARSGSAHEEVSFSAGTTSAEPTESQLALVVVGRPSGSRPVNRPPTASIAGIAADPQSDTFIAPLHEPDFTMTVRSGHSLSMICQQHYHSARADLVRALAHYNSLTDPDRIRVGQTLHLPALEKLQAVLQP